MTTKSTRIQFDKMHIQEFEQRHRENLEDYFASQSQKYIQQLQAEENNFNLYRLWLQRCDFCYEQSNYKMVSTSKSPVFLLCEKCYSSENEQNGSFMLMSDFVEKINAVERQVNWSSSEAQMIYCLYQQHLSLLLHKVNQLHKIIATQIGKLGKGLRSELSNTISLYGEGTLKNFVRKLGRNYECSCQDNCCFCEDILSDSPKEDTECKLKQQKQAQNQIINRILLFQSLESTRKVTCDLDLLEVIQGQVEIIITSKSKKLQHLMNQIADELGNISILKPNPNLKFKNKSIQSENQQNYLQSLSEDSITKNVINHFTQGKVQSILLLPIEKLTIDCLSVEKGVQHFSKIIDKANQLERFIINDDIISEKIQRDGIFSKTNKQINLKYIAFNTYFLPDQSFLDNIMNCTKITQLHLFWDYYNYFQQFNSIEYFKQSQKHYHSKSIDGIQYKNLFEKLKLQNIWIGSCSKEDESLLFTEILKTNFEQITNMIIGQFDGVERKIHSQLHDGIQKLANLQSLYLCNIDLSSLPQLFFQKVCAKMKCLYVQQCTNVSRQMYDQIFKMQDLQKLAFVRVSGVEIPQASSLKLNMFCLSNCPYLIGQPLPNFLKTYPLSYLNLYGNIWLDDKILTNILSNLQQINAPLRHLNIGYSQVTNKSMQSIDKFQLSSLSIGGTQISLQSLCFDILRDKFKNWFRIQKLSLCEIVDIKLQLTHKQIPQNQTNEYFNDIFALVLEKMPALSNLDISHNPVINERAIRFGLKYLTYLNVKGTRFCFHENDYLFDHLYCDCPFAQNKQKYSNSTELQTNMRKYNHEKMKIHLRERLKEEPIKYIFDYY